MNKTTYMNPYLAGFMLGLVLLFTIYITGRGLGASGAVKSVCVATANTITPAHTANTHFYQEYTQEHPESPLKSWLVFEVIGVIVGAFVSGLISDRLKFSFEKGPRASTVFRVVFALLGGALFGFGAQFGRGCTSGAALSGMAVLSTGGFITIMAIFGTAYAIAWFFRKYWI
jgi:hypothetical protein